MPRILRGAKLATMVTCLPTISSGLKCIAMPERMVLFSKPRSTNNSKSLSAFSTFFASTIVPTRRSIFPKSSKTISGFKGAIADPFIPSVAPALLFDSGWVGVFSILVFLASPFAFNCASSAAISSSSIFLNNNSGARKL